MADNVTGQKIVRVREMTPKEMEDEGWERWDEPPTVMELENGTKLYPSRDPEGNGPGAMFGMGADGGAFRLG